MKKDSIVIMSSVAAVAVLGYLLLRGRAPAVVPVVSSREYNPLPGGFSIPPLDLSGLGVVGATPINWPTTTGVVLPPILQPQTDTKKCCANCSDNSISSWSQNLIDALNLGPMQPYINAEMLTSTERAAIDLGQAQVVYAPDTQRGFFVAVLANGYAGAPNGNGIIYQGAMPVLPPTGPGG